MQTFSNISFEPHHCWSKICNTTKADDSFTIKKKNNHVAMKTAILSYSGWVMCLWLWTCCCLDSTFDSTRLTQDCNLRHSGSWRQRGRLSNKTNSLSVHSVHTYCTVRDRLSHALSHKSGPMPKVKEAPPPCYNRGWCSRFAPYSMIVYHNVAAPYPIPFTLQEALSKWSCNVL